MLVLPRGTFLLYSPFQLQCPQVYLLINDISDALSGFFKEFPRVLLHLIPALLASVLFLSLSEKQEVEQPASGHVTSQWLSRKQNSTSSVSHIPGIWSKGKGPCSFLPEYCHLLFQAMNALSRIAWLETGCRTWRTAGEKLRNYQTSSPGDHNMSCREQKASVKEVI